MSMMSETQLRRIVMSSGLCVPEMGDSSKSKEEDVDEQINTHTLQNEFNVRKSALQIVKKSDGDLALEFTVDATSPCVVHVLWDCLEIIDSRDHITKAFKYQHRSDPLTVSSGLEQRIRCPAAVRRDKRTSNAASIADELRLDSNRYDLIILINENIEAENDSKTHGSFADVKEVLVSRKRSQITYVQNLESKDTAEALKVRKQKIHVNGTCFELFDIFGIKTSSDEELCVICMTDKKEVAVLPCRHMCLCVECVHELRLQSSKCPICRRGIDAFIRIKRNEEAPEPPSRRESQAYKADNEDDDDVSTKSSSVERTTESVVVEMKTLRDDSNGNATSM